MNKMAAILQDNIFSVFCQMNTCNWEQVIIGSGKGFRLNRQQTITWMSTKMQEAVA